MRPATGRARDPDRGHGPPRARRAPGVSPRVPGTLGDRGYCRNAGATAALIRGDWLDTGDLGYVAAGDLFVTGRVKDLIIRAGRNIHPEELEEAGGTSPGSGLCRRLRLPRQGDRNRTARRPRRDPRNEPRSESRAPRADQHGRRRPARRAARRHRVGRPRTILKTSSGKIRRSASRTLYEQGAIGRRRWPGWLGTARLAWPAALPQLVRVRRAATAIAYNGCIWMLIGVAALPLLTLMLLLPYRSWRLAAGRTAIGLLFRLSGAPLVVDGDHHLEGLERFVIVTNHPSYLDGSCSPPPSPVDHVRRRRGVRPPDLFAVSCCAAWHRVHRAAVVPRASPTPPASQARPEPASTSSSSPEAALSPVSQRRSTSAPFRRCRRGHPVVPVAIDGTRSILRPGRLLLHGCLPPAIGQPIMPTGEDFGAAVHSNTRPAT